MIAVDTNILVYAHREDSRFHPVAKSRVRALAEGRDAWCIAWTCIHEFYAIVTHPRVYDPPTPIEKALEQIDAWLASPKLVMLAENDVYWPVLREALSSGSIVGPRVHDARIASICAAQGIDVLWSADRDFSRFPALTTQNPLVG